ncbi:hypothetical protein GPX89_36950 [Nocardia sp. ET3-3]|uniref:Uncharacterized protein n=1 Tax=Nocardia terrae TaxID=2675851 RepID=A0A7K1V8K1_9NOCA|nr:hypothetical protein [Nocardia terrae]MVU82811.1 hypothetical protein [Nocardia terrae]
MRRLFGKLAIWFAYFLNPSSSPSPLDAEDLVENRRQSVKERLAASERLLDEYRAARGLPPKRR